MRSATVCASEARSVAAFLILLVATGFSADAVSVGSVPVLLSISTANTPSATDTPIAGVAYFTSVLGPSGLPVPAMEARIWVSEITFCML